MRVVFESFLSDAVVVFVAIMADVAEEYLSGGVDAGRIGGSMTVAADTSHLGTPAQLYDGLRLDYGGTHFNGPGTVAPDSSVYVIRFRSDEADQLVPSYNTVMGGTDARVDGWADPFTGNGFTKAGDDVVPEYMPPGRDDIMINKGAEIWEVTESGTQRLFAVFDGDKWIPQGN